MAMLDSAATFTDYLVRLGLHEYQGKFEQRGFRTLGEFAFSTSYAPGASDDKQFISEVATPILGEATNKIPALRRLFFEAYTLMTAEMRSRIEQTDDDKPKKLSLPERESRLDRVKPKLNGLDLAGAHDVSESLVDLCAHIRNRQRLKYVPWEVCTTQAEENKGTRGRPEWKPDASGNIKEYAGENNATTKSQTDFQLFNLMVRRGIGADMGGLMTFETHQKLSTRLLADLEAPPPPGFQKVTYSQIRAADETKRGTFLARLPERV